MKRCYVLGAGFSKNCGLPLASELTEQVFKHVYPASFFQSKIRDAYLGYLWHLYPGCDLEKDWPDFEDLITVLDEWERYRVACEGTANASDPPNPQHFKIRLLHGLCKLLCKKTSACSHDQMELVERFIRQVMKDGSTIISFNWDLLLEIACKKQGISVSYDGKISEGIQIAKPHGSLNLAEISRNHYNKARDSINFYGVDIDWEENEKIVIRACDPGDALNRITNFTKASLLVEPTARKSYSSGWIRLQWQCALDMFREAEEICVIGYSLPETDFRPRILFQLAGMNRGECPRICLVDPKANNIAERYKKFINLPIDSVNKTWDSWFNTLTS